MTADAFRSAFGRFLLSVINRRLAVRPVNMEDAENNEIAQQVDPEEFAAKLQALGFEEIGDVDALLSSKGMTAQEMAGPAISLGRAAATASGERSCC